MGRKSKGVVVWGRNQWGVPTYNTVKLEADANVQVQHSNEIHVGVESLNFSFQRKHNLNVWTWETKMEEVDNIIIHTFRQIGW